MLYNQPQNGAKIDWSSPLARKLVFAYDPVSRSVYSSANPQKLASNTSTRSTTRQGLATATSGSAADTELAANSTFFADKWTSIAVVSFQSIVSPSCVTTVAASPGSSTSDRALFIDGTGHLTAYLYDGVQKFAADPALALADTPYVLASESDGANLNLWKNGVKVASTAVSNGGYGYGAAPPMFVMGYGFNSALSASPLGSNTSFALALWFSPNLTAGEHASLAANPWQLFVDEEEDDYTLYAQAAGGGITGTLASTEGGDTLAASGSVLIGGTLAKTEGADTLSADGSVLVSGALAATEGADTLASSGTVGNAIMGTLAVTEGSDMAAGSGSVLVSGTLARTEGADTLAAAGNVIPSAITGTLAVTEGADTLAATNIVAQPGGGDGGGAGPVREVRAYARQFDRLNKPTRAQKKRRRLELVEEALELLPDNEAAEQAAPIIAGIVFNREASAIDRYGKSITFDAETALRAQVAAWIQQRAAEDAEEEEIALQLLLMG